MKLLKTEMLILRTCNDNGQSYGGFQWPKKGTVSAPDWRDDFKCGGGLHGLPWGVGKAGLLNLDSKCWIVFKAFAKDVRQGKDDMAYKCKVNRGIVVYCGDKNGALAIIHKHAPKGSVCIFGVFTAGGRGTATAGGVGWG